MDATNGLADIDDDYEEALYLSRYPDIAAAVARGDIPDGRTHYHAHGRAEGRSAGGFDERFYLTSYPIAAQDIAAGRAADARDHYRRFGRGRGFLPLPLMDRPRDAARMPEFGGFWPDRPDALDAVEGRLEIGSISKAQADQLRFWISNGYVILPSAGTEAQVDQAVADLDRAYQGGFPGLAFECGPLGRGHMAWTAEMNALPAKALDLHCFSAPMRALMFAPAITTFLGLLFESRVFASQSLAFLRGSAQEQHQDSAYVAYTIPRRFAASWIALEDVTIGAGELFYYDGSHRFPDFLYGGRFKSVSEAQRQGAQGDLDREIPAHVTALHNRAAALDLRKSVFAAKKGDALIWHADLVHGGNPISKDVTRKSLVTHYCPKRLAPLFAERDPTWLGEHEGHLYTTGQMTYPKPKGSSSFLKKRTKKLLSV